MWTEVMNALASIKRTTWSLVSQYAQVLDYDGKRLLLGFDSAGRAQSFGRGAHPDFLRQALIDVIGLDCMVEAIASSEYKAGSGPAAAAPRSAAPAGGPTGPGRPAARDSAPRDSAPADSVSRESVSRESAPRASVPREAPPTPAPRPARPQGAPPASRPAPERRPGSSPPSSPYDDIPPPLDEPPPEEEVPPDDGRSAPRARAVTVPRPPTPSPAPAPAPASPPPTQAGSTRVVRATVTPADDEPSADDADFEGSHLIGAQVVQELLGGRVIEERDQ